jgi:hypothetical protein
MNAVPIPPGAIASQNCKDEYMTVYQPSSDQLWDLWHMHKLADGSWGADWGGHMTNVSQNPGHFDARWGVTATSLPLMGGLIRLSDLQQGHIDHALAFAIPYAKQSVFSWPAQRTDGRGTDQWSLPEGARMRLDPSVNVAALNLSPLGRMVAQALQTYGMVLRDQTQDAMLFFSEQPPPGQSAAQAYGPYLGGKAAWQQFTGIPWDKMQLMPLSNSDCSVLQAPVGLPVTSFCGMPYSLTDQSPQGGSMAPGPGPKPKPSGSTPPPTNAASAGGQSSSSSSSSSDGSRPVVVKLACTVHRVRVVFHARRHERVRRVTVTVNGHRRHVHVSISRTRRSMSLRLSRSPGRRMTVTVRVMVKRGHKVSRRTIRRIYPACG